MPRPQRIEYESAFHHVMNRGRDRQVIFRDATDFEAFLEVLSEASEVHQGVFHAYCLMSNHYHLLIETPKANLSQVMKHVNGLYTQRYNRRHKKHGPLFRGRYKSVLVDEDAYLLPLSRYIHRNPIEVKRPTIQSLSDYPWSSYPAYMGKGKAVKWLARDKTYAMLGRRQRYKGYANYVGLGVDEDIQRFYSKGNVASVLGDKEFTVARKEDHDALDLDNLRSALEDKPALSEVLTLVSEVTKQDVNELRQRSVGRRVDLPYRAFAIYASARYSCDDHSSIAEYFGLSHRGSISNTLTRVRKEVSGGRWAREIKRLEKKLVRG